MIRTVFLTLLLSLNAFASAVTLDASASSVNIVPHSRYLIDTGATLNAESILGQMTRFKPAQSAIYNFGFVETPIWIAFDVRFPLPDAQEWVLRIDNLHIDEYRLYRVDGERLTLVGRNGDAMDAPKPYRCRTFWEPLETAGAEATFLLKIQTKGALQVPLSAETLQEAYRGESRSNLLFGLFYGVLVLLLVYNMVLYLVVKEIHYFNYLTFLASYMLFQLNFDGVGQEWLWPGNVWMANSGLAFFIFMTAVFGFRFGRYFLMLRRYAPETERVIYFAEVLSFVGVLCALFLDYHTAITAAAFWTAITPWILIYAGFIVLPHYRAARYYVVGWIVFLLATILVALNQLGAVPTHPAMFYVQQVGSLIQMILLSFALADRINMMKFDHLAKLREFNEKLQAKIVTKVDELRQKDQLMIQQSRQAAMGEMIENIAHQWRQPLNQLSLIQSNIFFEYELGVLDRKKMQTYQEQSEALMGYMTHTIDDFRNFFQPDRESALFCVCSTIEKVLELINPALTRYHMEVNLACEGRPKALGHENEFSQVMINLLNNAKDAMLEHRTEVPKIEIRVTRGDALTRVSVCDNGGGVDEAIIDRIFDPYFTTKFKAQGTGIGLYMVKMIMEKSINGSVHVRNSSDGACFTLELPEASSDEQ
jgi:signal transduction histidine kinase